MDFYYNFLYYKNMFSLGIRSYLGSPHSNSNKVWNDNKAKLLTCTVLVDISILITLLVLGILGANSNIVMSPAISYSLLTATAFYTFLIGYALRPVWMDSSLP